MKKPFYLITAVVMFIVSANLFAQISGTKNIPGDYASLAAAITDLNTLGVGAGGVTLNLLAGNPQTAPAGGYSITTITGTSGNQIIIQGNGNTITASGSLTAGALNDAIFKLIGADYVTITGFTMTENAANLTTAAGTNNMTEWGVALLYATTTNGAQNNTISNNTIDLNRTYQNTFGIYSNSTHTATAVTTSATATTTAGGNSGLKITGNSITDINIGIVVVGPTAAADHNDGLIIGGILADANNITNYGTTGSISSYANVSGTVNGILVRNTKNFTVSYNTITSSTGGTTVGTLRGIYIVSPTNSPTGTLTHTISNNSISCKSGLASGAILGIVVESSTGNSTTTLNISNNDFNNFGHTVSGTAAITMISNSAAVLNTNILSNTFTNLTVNTTGSFTFITNSLTRPASAVTNVNNNSVVTAFSKTGAGGTVTFYISNGTTPSSATETTNNNTFSNITVTGATTIVGLQSTDGSTSSPYGPSKTATGNTFSNITGGSNSVTLLNVGYSNSGISTNNASGNTINNVTGTGTITGISSVQGSQNFFSNSVFALSSTGASTVNGISITGGATQNIYKNKIYDIQANNASGAVNGISITGGVTVNIFNNLIADLRTPSTSAANPLNGININYTTASTSINVYYNTIYLNAASTGTIFGSSGIFHTTSSTATTAALTMRNNIIVNTSTTGSSSGVTVAYRRSSATLTNYVSTSNNNLFYAGTPSGTNLIFSDGTNNPQTLALYKALSGLSPRDAASITEMPNFLSTTGSNANFLHINTTIATQIESGASNISTYTDDFDGNIRQGNTGYVGTGSAPDIGADEFEGIPIDLNAPVISYTQLTNTSSLTNRTFNNVSITDASGVQTGGTGKPKCYYKRSSDANSLNDNTSATDGWKYVDCNGSSTPFDFTIDYSILRGGSGVVVGDFVQYFVTAEDLATTPNVGINSGTFAASQTTCFLDASAFPIGGTINSYEIVGEPLNGIYTVGVTLFRQLSGRNIEERLMTRKVKKIVPAENVNRPAINKSVFEQSANGNFENESSVSISRNRNIVPGKMVEIEVEEVYSEMFENGKKYTGDLFAKYPGNTESMVGDYATISAALTDLNNRGVDGPVTFLLLDNAYTISSSQTINSNISGISSTNTVTIKPQTGISPVITGNVTDDAVIKIMSSYVTLDGSNSGGTSRDMTIINNSTSVCDVVSILSISPTTTTGVTVKNCVLTGGLSTAGGNDCILISDGSILGNPGNFANITVQNNKMEKTYFGMFSTATSGTGCSFIGNIMTSTGANSIGYCGIYSQGFDGLSVKSNEIANIDGLADEDDEGIWLATGTKNTVVERNSIHSIANTAATWGVHGITVTSGTASCNITIKNNIIYDLTADGFAYTSTSFGADNPIAILIGNAGTVTQSGINIYNNTIRLSGNTLNQTNALSMGIRVGAGATTVNVVNNLVVNNLGLLSGTGLGAVALYVKTSNSQLNTCNNNCYFVNPSSGAKNFGRINTTGETTLSGWRTSSGKETITFSSNPVFVSGTDFHITATDLSVSGRGTYIAGVTDDYDGDARATSQSSSLRPVDVGADQYSPAGFTTGNTTIPSGNFYMDGDLRAVEKVGISGSLTGVLQYPGVRTPNNVLRPVDRNSKSPEKINSKPIEKDSKQNIKKKDGTSGGNGNNEAVNTPWIYWEILGMDNTTVGSLRFYYNEDQLAGISEGTLRLSYWNPVANAWDNNFVQSINTTNNYLEVTLPTGISWGSNSLFALEDPITPLPVVLQSFDISVNKRDAGLTWVTTNEINNKGFAIERKVRTSEGYSAWKEIGFVNGNGTINKEITYNYSDKKLNKGFYQYRLRQVDFNGNFEYFSPSNTSDVAIGNPNLFDISQNYPNPSNPKSKIDFQMPFDGKVSIKVYDLLGREVATLIDGIKTADFYTVEFDGTNLASGTYFYRIIAENGTEKFTKTLKMILVK